MMTKEQKFNRLLHLEKMHDKAQKTIKDAMVPGMVERAQRDLETLHTLMREVLNSLTDAEVDEFADYRSKKRQTSAR